MTDIEGEVRKALGYWFWLTFEYAAPDAPSALTKALLKHLDASGFEITTKGGNTNA